MDNNISTLNTDEIDIADIVSQLGKKWIFLLVSTLVGAVLAYIASSIFLPKAYESKATIFVQQSSLNSSLLKDLPISLGVSSDNSGYFVALLNSNTMLGNLNRQFNLSKKLFPGKAHVDNDEVIKKLSDDINVVENKSGSIDIIVHAPNSRLAADIANSMLDNLEDMVSTSSQRKSDYISNKLSETENKMRTAENDMVRFQERNNISEIDEETKGFIEKLSQLDYQLTSLNVEYQDVESQLNNGGDLDSLVDLEVKKKSLESSRAYLTKTMADIQQRIHMFPSVALRYARLKRKVELLSKTYEILNEQYQLAGISQHGADGDYQIIDKAMPVRKPISPRKALNAGLAGIICLFCAAFLVIKSSRMTYTKRHYNQ